jgi:hypothetical protein
MSIYAEKQTQDAQVFFHSQKQFAIHIFEDHSVAIPCSLKGKRFEVVLRVYCNVAT